MKREFKEARTKDAFKFVNAAVAFDNRRGGGLVLGGNLLRNHEMEMV